MSPDCKFYVYVHRRATDGSIFYVGKGSGRRRWRTRDGRNQYWKRVERKHGFVPEIILSGLTEECAWCAERILISSLPRLTNLAIGGGGPAGYKMTPEQLEARRRPQSPSHAAKSRVAKLGKKNSTETNIAIKLAKMKKIRSSDGSEYPSLNDAAYAMSMKTGLKCCPGNISKAASGVRNCAYGLRWFYV